MRWHKYLIGLLSSVEWPRGGQRAIFRFEQDREIIPDAVYLSTLPVDGTDQLLAIAFRNAIARICGVKACLLRPSDKCERLRPLMGWWEWPEFFQALDIELGMNIDDGEPEGKNPPRFFGDSLDREKSQTIMQWTLEMVKWWRVAELPEPTP